MNSKRNGVGVALYGGAGRQHGACSETFWASCIMLFVFPGKDGRVTGRTESIPESQMDYAHFLPLLAQLSPSLSLSIRWKQPTSLMWPFPVCGMRTKELHFQCSCRLFLPLFLCLSSTHSQICPSTFLLSLRFNDSILQACLTCALTES